MNKFDKLRPAPIPDVALEQDTRVPPLPPETPPLEHAPTSSPLSTDPESLSFPEPQLEAMVPFTQRLPEGTLERFYAFYNQLKQRHPKLKMWQVLNALLSQALEDTGVQQKVVDDLF